MKKSFKKTKKREKKIIKPIDKETERMNDLSKMVDDKFKNKLVNYRTKKEHLAKFIFWFSSEPDKTPDGEGYMFNLPKQSRSINDGFSSNEEKDIRKMFSNSKSKINSVSFQDGYQKLKHPTKLLERIFRTGKGHGPKITKTAVKLKYLYPPSEDIFYWSTPICQSNRGKWNCDPQIPILCVVLEQTFILEKKHIKEAIIDNELPYSLIDDYGVVYQGPESIRWENSELDIDVTEWSKKFIEGENGDIDGVYSWKEGGFHFGLNDNCFKIMF